MDWRTGRFWILALLVALAVGGGIALFKSERVADATETIDATADRMTGNHAVKVGQELKSQVRSISTQLENRESP